MEQQAVLAVHRARQGFVVARTAQANQIRGLLSEFGVVIPKGVRQLEQQLPEILEDAENGCRVRAGSCSRGCLSTFESWAQHVRELEHQIKVWHRESEASRRLEAIPGHRSDDGERAGGERWRCQDVQERPTARCMVRVSAATSLQRRQRAAAGHQ